MRLNSAGKQCSSVVAARTEGLIPDESGVFHSDQNNALARPPKSYLAGKDASDAERSFG